MLAGYEYDGPAIRCDASSHLPIRCESSRCTTTDGNFCACIHHADSKTIKRRWGRARREEILRARRAGPLIYLPRPSPLATVYAWPRDSDKPLSWTAQDPQDPLAN